MFWFQPHSSLPYRWKYSDVGNFGQICIRITINTMPVYNTFSKYQGFRELASNYTFDTFPVKTSTFERHEKITIWLLGKKLGFMEQWNGSLSNGNNSECLNIGDKWCFSYVPFSNGKIRVRGIHHGCAYLTYSLCTETSSKLSQDLFGLL